MAALVILLGAAIISCFYLAPAAKAFDKSRWGANYFPNIELITQDGKKVKFYDDLVKGKIVVIDLIYTHCVDSCPLETARLAQVQKCLGDRVGKDVFFYSISIDPEQDTPQVLKEYAEKYHARPGWLFLTGKKEDIDLLSKKWGCIRSPTPNDRDGHTPSVLIGNEETGQWMRNSATDNPRFLSILIGDWLNSWKYSAAQPTKNYSEAAPMKLERANTFLPLTARPATPWATVTKSALIFWASPMCAASWLTRFIQEPDKVLAAKDPVATALFQKYKQVRMPNLRLSNDDTAALVKFLQSQSAGQHKIASTGRIQQP